MSPEQEPEITDRLVRLEPAERIETLRTESIATIKNVLGCSTDRAASVLKAFENRKLIEPGISPRGGQLDQRGPAASGAAKMKSAFSRIRPFGAVEHRALFPAREIPHGAPTFELAE